MPHRASAINSSAGVTAVDRPERHHPGPADHDLVADRPVDLGQRLLRRQPHRQRHRRRRNIPAPAASRRTANGNLDNAAGLYLLGWKLDSSGNPPTNTSDLSLINVTSLSGKAEASTKHRAAGQSAGQRDGRRHLCRRRHGGRHGDAGLPRAPSMSMTARAAASRSPSPSSRPRANTWAYEATYAGDCRQPDRQPAPISPGHR